MWFPLKANHSCDVLLMGKYMFGIKSNFNTAFRVNIELKIRKAVKNYKKNLKEEEKCIMPTRGAKIRKAIIGFQPTSHSDLKTPETSEELQRRLKELLVFFRRS